MAKEELLDVFRHDENYEENEKLWVNIRNEVLGESDSEDEENDEVELEGANGGTAYEPPLQEPVTHQVCLKSMKYFKSSSDDY